YGRGGGRGGRERAGGEREDGGAGKGVTGDHQLARIALDRLLAPGQESRLQEAPSRPFVGIRAGYVVERDVAQIPGAISLELASPEVELAELLERQPITTTNGPAEQIRQILCCRT